MSVEYNEDIREQILSHLDGWVVYSTEPQPSENEATDINSENNPSNDAAENNDSLIQTNEEVPAFIDNINDYKDNPNKRVTDEEIQTFYEAALDKAYLHCNRFNVDDLTAAEEQLFIKGVCCYAASDLWNKYNIRVNNEDLEDVYIQSYGGLLYKQAIQILQSFINQRVTSLTSIKKNNANADNVWLM